MPPSLNRQGHSLVDSGNAALLLSDYFGFTVQMNPLLEAAARTLLTWCPMQDVAVDFLRRVRSIIETAEQGLVAEDDLASVRSSMNELLELDWVMPRAVSEVSIHWKLIEEALRKIQEGQADAEISSEQLDTAWSAYRDIEDVFKEHE